MRSELQRLGGGSNVTLRGTYDRSGKNQSMLICDVRDFASNKKICDHLWIDRGSIVEKAPLDAYAVLAKRHQDIFIFDACIYEYCRGNGTIDYSCKNIGNIRIVRPVYLGTSCTDLLVHEIPLYYLIYIHHKVHEYWEETSRLIRHSSRVANQVMNHGCSITTLCRGFVDCGYEIQEERAEDGEVLLRWRENDRESNETILTIYQTLEGALKHL